VTGVAVAASQDRPLADEPRQLPPQLDRLDEARPDEGDRPAAWSRADLRQRLERLPPGHPSSLQNADHPPPPETADRPERNFWSEVPRFQDAWAEHLRRWPEDRRVTTVDRSRDPEGSWRGDGNQYLSPEQHAQVREVIAGVREAEKSLTTDMLAAERENTCGARLDGMKHRLKSEDRLKEKIAEKIEHEPGRGPGDALREISDAIRYTFCLEPDNYADGYRDLKRRLESGEHRMIYSRNHWRDDPGYKGINTRWVTPEGQRFEVQFHTPESFFAKQQLTHLSYERGRNRLTGRSERRDIEAFHQEVCAFIRMPSEVESIPSYQEEGS
jgi:hypothetical protein